MKSDSGSGPDHTTLKRCDHQAFLEALDSAVSPNAGNSPWREKGGGGYLFPSIQLDIRPLSWKRLSGTARGGSGAEPRHVILLVSFTVCFREQATT
jgi:hypothetical protein